MSTETDPLSALMERYAAGDGEVFDELYRAMAPRLYRLCLRLAVRQPEADDVFQETFLKLHRARATYVSGANPLHWAFAIARSVYLSRLRHRRRHPEELGPTEDMSGRDGPHAGDGATPEAEALARDLLDVATLELSRMSEKNRIAYILLKEEDLSAKQAAEILGTTADAVKQRAHRAYEQLRAALGAAGWREIDHGSQAI